MTNYTFLRNSDAQWQTWTVSSTAGRVGSDVTLVLDLSATVHMAFDLLDTGAVEWASW